MKEANNNIPQHWEMKKLGELCFTTSGGTPYRGNSKFYEGNIPWVKSGELDKGLILDTEEKITEDAIKNSSAKIFPKGTLLIATAILLVSAFVFNACTKDDTSKPVTTLKGQASVTVILNSTFGKLIKSPALRIIFPPYLQTQIFPFTVVIYTVTFSL